MTSEDFTQKRKFYRLNYPSADRPVVTINKKSYVVLDVSEEGVRFSLATTGVVEFTERDPVTGLITFGTREKHQFKGIVLRIMEDACVVKMSTPIPLSLIMSEQRYLLQKYKTV